MSSTYRTDLTWLAGLDHLDVAIHTTTDPNGADPLSWDVEHAWTPILGPTAILCARRLARELTARPAVTVDLEDLARQLGVAGRKQDRIHRPLPKALARLIRAGHAHRNADTYELSLTWPPPAARRAGRA